MDTVNIYLSSLRYIYFIRQPSPPLVTLHVADFQYLVFLILFLHFVTDVTSVMF